MPKLTMVTGLPASGKSTWAKAQVKASTGQTKRINMDDLRSMFDDGEWSKGNEKWMQQQRRALIVAALADKKNVLVDDVNLHPKHETMLREVAQEMGATFGVQSFRDVSVEECIRRDLLRTPSVGEKVIRKFWKQFLYEEPVSEPAPLFIVGLPRAIIVDLDGTVARMSHRGPHDYDKVGTDDPRPQVIAVVQDWVRARLKEYGDWHLIFCSGRPEKCREGTEVWVKEHVLNPGIMRPEWSLFMRPDWIADPRSGTKKPDHRNDAIVKTEIYHNEIEGNYNVDFCLDDRDRVVAAWRALGLLCLQVAPGNF